MIIIGLCVFFYLLIGFIITSLFYRYKISLLWINNDPKIDNSSFWLYTHTWLIALFYVICVFCAKGTNWWLSFIEHDEDNNDDK